MQPYLSPWEGTGPSLVGPFLFLALKYFSPLFLRRSTCCYFCGPRPFLASFFTFPQVRFTFFFFKPFPAEAPPFPLALLLLLSPHQLFLFLLFFRAFAARLFAFLFETIFLRAVDVYGIFSPLQTAFFPEQPPAIVCRRAGSPSSGDIREVLDRDFFASKIPPPFPDLARLRTTLPFSWAPASFPSFRVSTPFL